MIWVQSIWGFLSSENGDTIAGWAGLILTIVGFVYTIRAVKESKAASKEAKAASERAEKAAQEAVEQIGKLDEYAQLTEVSSLLEQLATMERENVSLAVKADRYSMVRMNLTEVRTASALLSSTDKTKLQSIITNCKLIVESYDEAIHGGQPTDPRKILGLLGDMQQMLSEVSTRFRQRMSSGNGTR